MFRYACNADFCRSIEASAPPPPESSVQKTLVWAGLGTRLAENNPKAVVEENMPPDIPLRTQLDVMEEKIIKNLCKENNLQNITYLNLFNNKIKKINGLSNLTKLKIPIIG